MSSFVGKFNSGVRSTRKSASSENANDFGVCDVVTGAEAMAGPFEDRLTVDDERLEAEWIIKQITPIDLVSAILTFDQPCHFQGHVRRDRWNTYA